MMWTVMLLLFSYVVMLVAINDIKLHCDMFHEFPPYNASSPSKLAGLNVELLTEGGSYILNISWAINIDASIHYLTATRIEISGQPDYRCEYDPPLAKADLVGEEIWFHYAVETDYGFTTVSVSNLPLPELGGGRVDLSKSLDIPRRARQTVTHKAPPITAVVPETKKDQGGHVRSGITAIHVIVTILGGLAGLMILCSCYLIYKHCGSNVATSLGFKNIPISPMVPTPVLVVYPPENPALHRAVVELAEFLQWYGGCSVAIDMWQQEKIAELGPMRWLVEQANSAERVLIIPPQPSLEHHQYPPTHSFPEPAIPAAAHDLYPLILNMVASHAKSANELAKFWVVQLGQRRLKRSHTFPLELSSCKTFCLMKDLSKLCKSLCDQWKGGKKMPDLFFRPGLSYSEKNTEKLRKAVEKLTGHQPSISREEKLLKSGVTSV